MMSRRLWSLLVSTNLPFIFTPPLNTVEPLRSLGCSADVIRSVRRKGFGTARGFTTPLSLVIYVATSPSFPFLSFSGGEKKETIPRTSHQDYEDTSTPHPMKLTPMKLSTLLLSCWLSRSEVCSVISQTQARLFRVQGKAYLKVNLLQFTLLLS